MYSQFRGGAVYEDCYSCYCSVEILSRNYIKVRVDLSEALFVQKWETPLKPQIRNIWLFLQVLQRPLLHCADRILQSGLNRTKPHCKNEKKKVYVYMLEARKTDAQEKTKTYCDFSDILRLSEGSVFSCI